MNTSLVSNSKMKNRYNSNGSSNKQLYDETSYGLLMSRKVRPEWSMYNLNYDEMHKRLIVVKSEFGMRKAISSRSLTGETRTFAEILDQEVEKIVLFYLRLQGELAQKLWNMREKQLQNLQLLSLSIDQIDILCKKYRELGKEVIELLNYLDVNVIALRKILKIHDKQFDLKMTNIYFDSRLGSSSGNKKSSSSSSGSSSDSNSQLLQLYHQEGLRAIIGTIKRAFEDLYEARSSIIEASESINELLGDKYNSLDSNNSSSTYDNSFYIDHHYTSNPMKASAPLEVDIFPSTNYPRTSYMSRMASSSALHDAATPTPSIISRNKNGSMSTTLLDSVSNRGCTRVNQYKASTPVAPVQRRNIFASFFPFTINSYSSSRIQNHDRYDSISRSINELEPILKDITDAANRVMRTQKRTTTEYLAYHSEMSVEMKVRDMAREEEGDDNGNDTDSDIDDDDDAIGGTYGILGSNTGTRGRSNSSSYNSTYNSGLYLNLFATFLYQANQYVVGPTSGKYANLLGETESMSGFIIGLSPLAALISAIVFSAWTNHSFKEPLVVSLLFLIVGNLSYGLALQFDSVLLMCLGRLMSGLGAPRGIARRYIADHVPLHLRTVASSHFVTAGALGLAVGPLISSLVTIVDYSTTITIGKYVIIRYEVVTAPGFIMSFLFLLSLISVLLYFEDPLLAVQRNKDMLKGIHTDKAAAIATATANNYKSPMHDSSQYGDMYTNTYGHAHTITSGTNSGTNSGNSDKLEMKIVCVEVEMGRLDDAPATYQDSISGMGISGNSHNHHTSAGVGTGTGTGMFTRSIEWQTVGRNLTYATQTTRFCWENISIEVAIILFIYFVNKTGQETVVSSIPTLSTTIIGWNSEQSGYFMAVMGACVLPANILVSRLSKDSDDRTLMIVLSSLSVLFLLLILNTPLIKYSLFQYILGSVLLFSSLNALEGIIMSLLSKLVSPELAKGTFNSGLLATEAGTFGRVIGDMAITLSSLSVSGNSLINTLFVPIGVGLVLTIMVCLQYYHKFEV